MPTPTQIRLYSMADGELKQLADSLALNITRDLTEFGTRNMDVRAVDNLQLLIDAFDNTTTDQELLGVVVDRTAIKDAIVKNIHKAVRIIRNMAELQYQSAGKYATFGFEDMTRLSDSDLYRFTRRIVRVGNMLLPELVGQGLTVEQLTDLGKLATDLDNALDKIDEAIDNRDIETQDRVIKGNTLWQEVSRLASVGKSLFVDTNEAKYNDYVLIGSTRPPASPTPPTP